MEHTVFVYSREIRLEVVIPEGHVWSFIKDFGETFFIDDTTLGKRPRPIDSYDSHPNGWHIKVTINDNHEEKFYNFLNDFAKRMGLQFIRDPE